MPRWDRRRLRRAAAQILASALRAADPAELVRTHLRRRGRSLWVGGRRYSLGSGRVVLVAAGKAACVMASAAEAVLGDALDDGLAVDTSSRAPLRRTRLALASHPVPDARGLAAAGEVERLARGLGRDDLLLILLSGGASALLPAPVDGVSLEQKADVTRQLLRAGTPIQELNAVRKHLSRLKGGGLARVAAPARVACLMLSDVIGDDLSTIASGPTVPDPSTFREAKGVLVERGVWSSAPEAVRRHVEAGCEGRCPETPKPGAELFERVETRIIGSNRGALHAAALAARGLGLRPVRLTSRLEGEAREAGRVLASILRECAQSGRPFAPPVCLLAGGETVVTVTGDGRGGRNQELVLGAVETLAACPVPVLAAALGTDGIDGVSDAAGAVADDATLVRAERLGLPPPAAFLAANDSSAFFAALGDLILTGPTGTNVADVTVLLAGANRGTR